MKSFASRIKYAGLGLAVASSLAFGSVILNDDGSGWVGKGDVQNAFGWNNAQAQTYVNDVSFSFQQTSTYVAVCEWFTGPDNKRKPHDVTRTRSVAINSTVGYDARKRGQYTGYFLTAFGETTVSGGEVPVVGGTCLGQGLEPGSWISVEETSASEGALYVTFQGNSVLLPETPPPEPVL